MSKGEVGLDWVLEGNEGVFEGIYYTMNGDILEVTDLGGDIAVVLHAALRRGMQIYRRSIHHSRKMGRHAGKGYGSGRSTGTVIPTYGPRPGAGMARGNDGRGYGDPGGDEYVTTSAGAGGGLRIEMVDDGVGYTVDPDRPSYGFGTSAGAADEDGHYTDPALILWRYEGLPPL